MTLDIRGSLKNTRINQNHYVVIDELLSNAIDSFLIRCTENNVQDNLNVQFIVEFYEEQLIDGVINLKITCIDNGAGFGNARTKAFVTKDTSYKDDLAIEGIGHCKGSGRIQFLHYFRKIEIDSVYSDGQELKRKKLLINETIKEVNEDSFEDHQINGSDYKTRVTLESIKSEVLEKVFSSKKIEDIFSAESLRQHVLVAFLQRLVSLKDSLGNFLISFKSTYKDQLFESQLQPVDIPKSTTIKELKVFYGHQNTNIESQFEEVVITHYKLDKEQFSLKENTVALCAKSSIVKNITNRFLKNKSLINNDIDGFYHIILIESKFLDGCVNEQRDNFNIPQSPEDELFGVSLSYEELFDQVHNVIIEMLSPPDWDKEAIVRSIETKFGMSASMINEARVRVHYGDTEESVVKRVLNSYQEGIIQDTSEIFDMKQQIAESDPSADDYREKVNQLTWKYTSSLKNIDMVNLSQLVVRRAAVLEILRLAVRRSLTVQGTDGRKNNESIIHQIFFPMRMDSESAKDHDIWILNEEYQYYAYIASDKSLANIPWDGNDLLFDETIDDELEKLLS